MEENNNTDAMRLGYARVSTDDQDLSLQLRALEKAGVDRVFQEHASGASMRRPEWFKLRRAARSGDTIVVWKLDRLGRSVKGVLDEIEDMDSAGIELEVVTEGLDTSTPVGRMMRNILLSFAQMERELTSERTKAGMEAKRAQGHVFGRRHSITGYPERIEAMRAFVAKGGDLHTVAPSHVLAILNGENGQEEKLRARLRKLRKIESAETFRRWRRDGFPGLNKEEPSDDG